MALSLATAHEGLKDVLTSDAGLDAWALTHLTKSITPIDGNLPVDVIEPDEAPALIFELGDGESSPVVSNYEQEAQTAINCALVWFERDPAKAFEQRLALPDLAVKAVMANHTLADDSNIDRAAGAWVSAWSFAVSEGNADIRVFRFTVSVEFPITNP